MHFTHQPFIRFVQILEDYVPFTPGSVCFPEHLQDKINITFTRGGNWYVSVTEPLSNGPRKLTLDSEEGHFSDLIR